jgi:hypothetical protein
MKKIPAKKNPGVLDLCESQSDAAKSVKKNNL